MSNRRKTMPKPTPDISAKVTLKLQLEARAKGWTGGQMLAVAMQRANPDADDIRITMPPNPEAPAGSLARNGYVAIPEGSYPLAEDDGE